MWDTPYSREYHWYIQSNVIHEESVLKGLVEIPVVMAHTLVCTQDVAHHTQDSMQVKDCQ